MELLNLYQIYTDISNSIQQAPLFILSKILQSLAFSLTICYGLSYILSLVHFQYADFITESKLTKALGACAYWYFKFWDNYNYLFYLASIFGMVFTSIYVYDCCCNISHGLESYNFNNRELMIIVSYSLMVVSTYVLYWFIIKNKQHPLEYEMLGIYMLIIIFILVGNLLRNRTVINTLLAVLFMNYLIGFRHYCQIKGYNIAIYAIPFILMSLDAEKKERKHLGGEGHLRIFKLCLALACLGILQNPAFPLEMILGSIFIFGLIINK